ncbi:MAG: hypothetical protein NTV06_02145 [candidate division Zixibacteria bacterium]|nr:hypothetical protein [candidate division Zixibacteria bacterium]
MKMKKLVAVVLVALVCLVAVQPALAWGPGPQRVDCSQFDLRNALDCYFVQALNYLGF